MNSELDYVHNSILKMHDCMCVYIALVWMQLPSQNDCRKVSYDIKLYDCAAVLLYLPGQYVIVTLGHFHTMNKIMLYRVCT